MTLAPYWKLLIPGLALLGEGGAMLYSGFVFSGADNLFDSLLGSLPGGYGGYGGSMMQMFSNMGAVFLVIGIISMCVGVPFLIAGLVRRSNYTRGIY